MRRTATKVAVSLPHELYLALERLRRKKRSSRSAVVQNALRRWVKEQEEAKANEEYIEAYRRMPETRQEIEEAEAMARDTWTEWEW